MSKVLISNPHFEDGTIYNPPENPLIDKWNRAFPPYSNNCEGYSCMWCSKCYKGEYFKVPEEDKEEYDKYKKSVEDYVNLHGGIHKIYLEVKTND